MTRFTLAQLLLLVTFCSLLLGLAVVVRQASVGSPSVQWLLFSPDGQTLVVGLDNNSIQAWNVPLRTRIAALDVGAAAQTLELSPACWTVGLPGKNELVTVDHPEEGLNRWDLGSQQARTTEAPSGLLSPDGNRLLAERPDGAVEVHHIGTDKPPVKLARRVWDQPCQMFFSADANSLAIWELDGTIETYDLQSGKQLQSIQVKEGLPGVLSSDLRWAAAVDADSGILRVHRVADGAAWLTITEPNDYFAQMAFSHDGRRLAVGHRRGTVTLWNLASRQPQSCASGHGKIGSLAFSPDGTTLAMGHADRCQGFRRTPIRLVDPITLEEQAVLGEKNYRPHMAVLLAGFIVWFVLWRWAKRQSRRAQGPQKSPDVTEVLLREMVPAAKIGRLWVGRELALSRDGLVVSTRTKRITIPRESIDKLTSEGRWGFRCFRVVHRDNEAPADIRFQSFRPAKWFEAFEQAGIPTEDPVELKSSWALGVKLAAADEIIEMLSWSALFVGAIVFCFIAALVQGCAG